MDEKERKLQFGQKEIELLESFRALDRIRQEYYYCRIKADAIEKRLHERWLHAGERHA